MNTTYDSNLQNMAMTSSLVTNNLVLTVAAELNAKHNINDHC